MTRFSFVTILCLLTPASTSSAAKGQDRKLQEMSDAPSDMPSDMPSGMPSGSPIAQGMGMGQMNMNMGMSRRRS